MWGGGQVWAVWEPLKGRGSVSAPLLTAAVTPAQPPYIIPSNHVPVDYKESSMLFLLVDRVSVPTPFPACPTLQNADTPHAFMLQSATPRALSSCHAPVAVASTRLLLAHTQSFLPAQHCNSLLLPMHSPHTGTPHMSSCQAPVPITALHSCLRSHTQRCNLLPLPMRRPAAAAAGAGAAAAHKDGTGAGGQQPRCRLYSSTCCCRSADAAADTRGGKA